MVSHPTVTRTDIETAADRLDGHIRRTPIITVDGAQLDTEGTVTLKLEHLQHSGTFKGRGATNFMLANADRIGPAGVTAASGGNHGAAVAWAARRLGHKASVFVPTISAPAKVSRLQSYGAMITQTGAVYGEALEACEAFQTETGALGIHAYEDPDVFAGAGTTGLELRHQANPFDAVLVACGGGGLVGGIATSIGSTAAVVACETEGTAAFHHAVSARHPVDIEVRGVAADALGATRIGTLPFAALDAADAASVLVSDQAVVAAQALLWDRFRLAVEPSAAVPVAALSTGAWQPGPSDHTAVIICGANTSLANLDDLGGLNDRNDTT